MTVTNIVPKAYFKAAIRDPEVTVIAQAPREMTKEQQAAWDAVGNAAEELVKAFK